MLRGLSRAAKRCLKNVVIRFASTLSSFDNCLLAVSVKSIRHALDADSRRHKRDRRTALMLFEAIKKDGYTGGYSILTDYVRNWRNDLITSSKSAYVPLKFELGEAFQFDWSDEWLMVGGIHRKIQAAHTKLCASRAFFLSAYPTQTHEMLYDAHTRAFSALGGIPKRGIYDNMKTAVDKVVKRTNGRVVNSRFYAMTAHYLFEPDFCNVASGWEKGIVEKNVQDSRRRVWIEAKTQSFNSFEELNVWLDERCRTLWSEIEHPNYAGITLAAALEHEQLSLMPMPTPFDGYVEIVARVSSTCLVTVERNQYSVPCHLANSRATIHLYSDRVESTPSMPTLRVMYVYWAVMKSVTTGSTIFCCLRKSLVHYATAHPLRRCRFFLLNYKPLYDAENGNKVIGLWLKCWPPYLLMVWKLYWAQSSSYWIPV